MEWALDRLLTVVTDPDFCRMKCTVRCGVRLQLPAKGTVNDVGMNILHIVYLFGCRSRIHHYY